MKTWLGIVFIFLGNFYECHQSSSSNANHRSSRRQVPTLPSSSGLLEEMITLPSKNLLVVRRPLAISDHSNLFRDDVESRLNLAGSEKIEVTQQAPAPGLPDFSIVDTITNEPLEIFDDSSTYPPLDAALVETFLTEPHVQSASQQIVDVRPQPLDDPKPTIIFGGFDEPIRMTPQNNNKITTRRPFLNHENTFFHETAPIEKFKVVPKDAPVENQNSQISSPIQETRNLLLNANTLGPTAQKTLHLGLTPNALQGSDFTQEININKQVTTPENIQDSANFNFPRINPKIKPVSQINTNQQPLNALQPFAHQQIIIHQSIPQKMSLLLPGIQVGGNQQKGVKSIKFHVPQVQFRKQNNFSPVKQNNFAPANLNAQVTSKPVNHGVISNQNQQQSNNGLNQQNLNGQINKNVQHQNLNGQLNKLQSAPSSQRNFHALPPQSQKQQQAVLNQPQVLNFQAGRVLGKQNDFSNQQQKQQPLAQQQFQAAQQTQQQTVIKPVQKQNIRGKVQQNQQQKNWNNGNNLNFSPTVQQNQNQVNLRQQNNNLQHNLNNQHNSNQQQNNHQLNANQQINNNHQLNANQQQNNNNKFNTNHQQNKNSNQHNTNQQHNGNTNQQHNGNNHQHISNQRQNKHTQHHNVNQLQTINFQTHSNQQHNNNQQHQQPQNTNFQPNVNIQQPTNQPNPNQQHTNNQQFQTNLQQNTNFQHNQNQNQHQNLQISSHASNNHNSMTSDFDTSPKTATLVFDSRPFTIIHNSLQPSHTHVVEGPSFPNSLQTSQNHVIEAPSFQNSLQTSQNHVIEAPSFPNQQLNNQPQFTQEIQVINDLPPDDEINEPTADDPDGDGIIGIAGTHYPTFAHIFHTSFQCRDKPILPGTYADQEASCQMYHACSPDGSKTSFLCSPGTVFNQKYLICDWWYNVDCNNSPDFYNVNVALTTVPNINDQEIGDQKNLNNNFQGGGGSDVVRGNQLNGQNSFHQKDNGHNEHQNGQSQHMPFQFFPSAFSNPFNTNNN